MKATLTTLGVSIIVAFFTWWLNQDRFDVRYTLSEQIPLDFDISQQQESVQQIEVKNLGRKSAEGIQVKIPAKVLAFQISKNSGVDQPKTFDNADSFEVAYGSLPPQASFRLVFKTKGAGIAAGKIEVRQ